MPNVSSATPFAVLTHLTRQRWGKVDGKVSCFYILDDRKLSLFAKLVKSLFDRTLGVF